MPRRLNVIDGADKGQSYLLPEAGTIRIGNSRKHTDICLHDLFVARVHCQLDVGDERVTVSDQLTPNGILVNGAKVVKQELQPGDVVRVGNSYLRLEEVDDVASETVVSGQSDSHTALAPGQMPHLTRERLGALSNHTLGHYEIGVALGHGQTGVVFRAQDTKTDKTVALKVLPPDFPADDAEMQRFIRAMKTRLAVQHLGLVALKGVGRNLPYVWIATELIEGDSAATVIRHWGTTRKAKWRTGLRVALQMARVLEHLHRQRLVHGDITPANILLSTGDGPAKLNDLGYREAIQDSELQQAAWERKFHAELPYLSPEHVDADAKVDDLSDQYCLGAVVYGLLTGHAPVEAETPEEIVERVRSSMPTRPKEFQRSLPDAFQAVVLRMLAKHPEERYPAPNMLLADLEAVAVKHDDER